MASFSTKIKSKYELNTYKGTKDTYEWINTSIKKLELKFDKTEVSFQFDIGKINCCCDSIEEFINYAYGQEDYSLTSMGIVYYLDSNIYIDTTIFGEIRVSTDSKVLLENVINVLESSDGECSESVTNNYIQNNYEIGTISGNNNLVVQGIKSNINQQKVEKSTFKQWIESILQNLIANWLWIAIPIVIAAIIGFFANK